MNVVDMNGRPIAADRLPRRKSAGPRGIGIDPEIALRLCEVDPTKLLGYLGSMLPVDDLEWQAVFVLDRARWLRTAAAVLLAEADDLSGAP